MYRGHDAFLFTSRYEAWGMPVLEAMASGLAVVATRCLGVESFAEHGSNCLLADPQVCGLSCRKWLLGYVTCVSQHVDVARWAKHRVGSLLACTQTTCKWYYSRSM